MTAGLIFPDTCEACGAELPPVGDPRRVRHATCDEVCHEVWIARVLAEFGETKVITHLGTGKRYRVPMRTFLEHGLRGTDLTNYPEVEPTDE